MQLINCKINYKIGEDKIYTTELKNSDYTILLQNEASSLKANIQTTKSIVDFKIEFYIKIDGKYSQYYTNGYQTWSTSHKLEKEETDNKFLTKISTLITKGSGIDFASEFDNPYNKNSSYGYCYFKREDKNQTLLFASLNEKDTFCKFNFDFTRSVLKITRDFKGFAINKSQELAQIVNIEGEFSSVLSALKNYLGIKNTPNTQKQLVCYNTFLEFKNQINDKIINDKIYKMKTSCDVFMVGDGYSECGYDLFRLDKKRFPIGFKQIIENIHAKEMLAGIWIAPFTLSPLAKNFAQKQNLAVKQKEKTITTCSFWNGAYSIDLTNPQSEEYLQNLFDRVCNEWGFDVVYCDCMFMAGSIPSDNHTQAMLISKGIDLVRKFTQGKTLILGGVPFLSAISKCDYIAISQDGCSFWNNPLEKLIPEFATSAKSSMQNLLCKIHQNLIYPCAYSIPNNAKIKAKLLEKIFGSTDCILTNENQIESVIEEKNCRTTR